MDERERFIHNIIKEKKGRILEIGPLNRPIVAKDQYKNVYYCDIRNTAEIKALYAGNDYLESTGIKIDIDSIVDVDYVIKGTYTQTFSEVEKFDYIILSHVMEHMEDIIGFLQDVINILTPKGKLCIIYPDKRYCFDHFRVEASFRDAYDVFIQGTKEVSRMTLDFFYNVIEENDAVKFWNGTSLIDLFPQSSFELAKKNYELALQNEKIPDVHYWQFTDKGFLKFIYDCLRANLINFKCKEFIPTKVDSQQFMIVLEKDNELDYDYELEQIKQRIFKFPEEYYNKKWIQIDNEYKELKNNINQLLTERLEIQKKLDEKQNVIINLQNEIQKKLDEKQNVIIDLQNEIINLKNETMEATQSVSNNQIKSLEILENYGYIISQKEQEIKELKEDSMVWKLQVESLRHSTCWKMTAPIRTILDWLKR